MTDLIDVLFIAMMIYWSWLIINLIDIEEE